MSVNNRIYYPMQQVAFRAPGTTAFQIAKGVQSAQITTTFNLEQAFTFGQLAIYENIEGIPAIDMSISKVLDGYPLLYCLATATDKNGSALTGPELSKRAVAETMVQLGIWPETRQSVSGNPETYVEMSGMVVGSVNYNFNLNDNFTEEMTLVGNRKVWSTNAPNCTAPWTIAGASGNVDFWTNDDAPYAAVGVARRQDMSFGTGVDQTRLPQDIYGVASDGSKSGVCHVNSIRISCDLNREDLFELGTKAPYAKTVTFPVEVTCEIEVNTVSGDQVSALDYCGGATGCGSDPINLTDRTIRVATCEGTRLFLGNKNKLQSVTYGGGDAGGGNATVTYSYRTFNDLTILHSGDVSGVYGLNPLGNTWWNSRGSYLV